MKRLLFVLMLIPLLGFSQSNKALKFYEDGLSAYNKRNYSEAIKSYSSALHMDTGFAYAYLGRGKAKLHLEDYNGAIADYNKYIELVPDIAVAYYLRGLAKEFLEDYVGAMADYSKAIELKPEYEYYSHRCFVKYKLKDYLGVIDDFNKAIKIDSEKTEDYFNSAYRKNLLRTSNSMVNAIVYFESGVEKHDVKDYEGAIVDFTKAIELGLDNTDVYYYRGMSKYHFTIQDYKGAIADYTKAIELKSDHANAFFNRGRAKENLKDYNGAITDYTKAIDLKPDDSDAYYNRGRAKDGLLGIQLIATENKDYSGVRSDLERACELGHEKACEAYKEYK